MIQKRDKSIDALKGLSILCIVLLHYSNTLLSTWSYVWISRFMITTFYFTSGWLSGISTKEQTITLLYKKRLRSLGIPYISFTAIILCFDFIWLTIGNYEWNYILKDIYKAIILRGIGTLWFLPALMGGELVVLWLRIRNKKEIWIGIGVITLIGVGFYDYWLEVYRNRGTIYQIIDAPLAVIVSVLRAWPIIFFGHIISKYYSKKIETQKKIFLLFTGIIILIVSILLCDNFVTLHIFKWFVTPSLAPLGLLLIFRGLANLKILNFFEYWGRNSLVVMATHYSILQVICINVCERFFSQTFTGWITLFFVIVTLIIEVPIIYLFNNTNIRVLLGK